MPSSDRAADRAETARLYDLHLCGCDRPDLGEDPHRHDRDTACGLWASIRDEVRGITAAADEPPAPTGDDGYVIVARVHVPAAHADSTRRALDSTLGHLLKGLDEQGVPASCASSMWRAGDPAQDGA